MKKWIWMFLMMGAFFLPVHAEEPEREEGTEVVDLQETMLHAQSRLSAQQEGVDSGLLSSKGRIAQFPAVADPSIPEYITMFEYEGRPAYCIEPEISTILDGSTHSSVYQSETWWNVDEATRMLCKRYAFFGYGFAGLGGMQYSPEAYAATQMLVWKKVSPVYYGAIESGVHMCPMATYENVYCTLDPSGIFSLMDTIENYAENYDTVPSFADEWGGLNTYDLKWDETLVLKDSNHVLSWFEAVPDQERRGVHVRVEGDALLVDIDDLYYSKEPLYFSRKSAQWQNMSNGIMVYTMPGSQRLMGESGMDPTPGYQLAFRLDTADLEVRKLDEYGNSGSFARNTEFVLGWYEDPERQYRYSGMNDLNWKGQHDPSIQVKSDETGLFNDKEYQSFYYPVRTEDGSSVRVFKTDEQGVLRIDGFLPADHNWWIREIGTENALIPYGEPMRVAVGGTGSSSGYSVINGLRDVTLSLSKRDVEEEFLIDGALFEVYEIGDLDLDKEDTHYGLQTTVANNPVLSYEMLKEWTDLNTQDSFLLGSYKYTIVQEEEDKYLVRRVLFDPKEEALRISRYALPMDQSAFTYQHVLCRKGTEDRLDDESVSLDLLVSEMGQTQALLLTDSANMHVLYDASSRPSYEEFKQAMEANGEALSEGRSVVLDGITYHLYRVNEGSLLADVQKEVLVDLLDRTPSYEDLPDPEHLKVNDSFTLKWPVVLDDGTIQEGSIEFTVLSRDRESIRLRSEEGECTVNLPQWICNEEVADVIRAEQELKILSVQLPVYRVRDSRGNIYQIAETETKLLSSAEDPEQIGSLLDLSYAELTGMVENDTLVCHEPDSTVGCPLGKQVNKMLTITHRVPWSFPSFEEIQQKRESEEPLVFDDVEYSVVSEDEHTMIVSFQQEGKTLQGELAASVPCETAFFEEEQLVEFVIEEVQDKEFDVQWTNMQVPLTSLTTKDVLRMTSFQDPKTMTYLSSLRYDASSFTDENGAKWTVLYSDAVNHQAVVESVLGRFEVDQKTGTWAWPAEYADMLEFEKARGSILTVGETLAFSMDRPVCIGDEFSIGDSLMHIEDLEYEGSNGTERLRDQVVKRRLSWYYPVDPPFERAQFVGEEDVVLDGIEFERVIEHRADGTVYTLKDPIFGVAYVLQEKEILREQDADFKTALLQVMKPEGPTFKELQSALLQEKRSSQHVTVDGQQLLIDEEGCVELDDGTILSKEDLKDVPLDLVENDVYEIKGESWQIVSIVQEEETGLNVQLKRVKDQKVVTVQEHVPGTYPIVRLRFCGVDEPVLLQGMWRLAQSNPHLTVESEEGQTRITSDSNAMADLLKVDEDGAILDQIRMIFQKDGENKSVNGIAVFAGKTGSAHVRLVDPLDHNMPIACISVDVEDERGNVTRLKSDAFGVLDTSMLAEGMYTYVHPCTGERTMFRVAPMDERTGRLSIDQLKWGRTYMACEVGLPEGYDYGDSPVCHSFTMDLKRENEQLNGTVDNELRRLSLKVYKVDQEDQRILLDDAWFTVEEMPQEEPLVLAPLTLSDVPADVEAGSVFAVWPARKDGVETLYRLENVQDEQLIVSRLENGRWGTQLHVEKNGVSVESGMLYEDVKRACTLLKPGCVFRLKEKESSEQLKYYRVKELLRGNGTDVFGAPMEEAVLQRVVVEEVGDEAHEEIVLRADGPQDSTHDVQEYISGGLFIRRQIEVDPCPVSFEDVQAALQKGKQSVTLQRTRTARMPVYAKIREAYDKGEKELEQDGVKWKITCDETACMLEFGERYFEIHEYTKVGAVSYVEEEEGEILVQEDGRIYVRDPSGNVYKVSEEKMIEKQGEAGAYVSILNEEGEIVVDGYTDAEGKLIFSQFEEGTYLVQEPDRERTVETGKGMIHLPEVRYGHKLRICETKSPLGYMVSQSCAVFEPRAAYDVREVLNKRTNAKIRTTVRKRLIRYRMGVDLWQDA